MRMAPLSTGCVGPSEIYGALQGATGRPLDVGAKCAWRGVNIEHSRARLQQPLIYSIPLGATSPSTFGMVSKLLFTCTASRYLNYCRYNG